MTKPLTGRKTFAIVLAIFGIVFAVNGYMVAMAVSTYTGEDENSAYLQGANYNQTLDRRAEQAALGWRATIGAEREQGHGLRVFVSVVGRNGYPVRQLRMLGVLRHPSDASRDRPLILKEEKAGVYAARLDNVASGAWDVVVHAGEHSTPFEATRNLWLR